MRRKLLWAVAATALAFVAFSTAERTYFSCPAEDVTFELVTGYVFRSPADILGWVHFFLCDSDHFVTLTWVQIKLFFKYDHQLFFLYYI